MCFADTPEAPKPSAPPEVLRQAAPEKKAAANSAAALAIGTKKYRSNSGLGPIAGQNSPSGIKVGGTA